MAQLRSFRFLIVLPGAIVSLGANMALSGCGDENGAIGAEPSRTAAVIYATREEIVRHPWPEGSASEALYMALNAGFSIQSVAAGSDGSTGVAALAGSSASPAGCEPPDTAVRSVNADTGSIETVNADFFASRYVRFPALSADGDRLWVAVSEADRCPVPFHLYEMSLSDRKAPRRLTPEAPMGSERVFEQLLLSPSERHIAFVTKNEATRGVTLGIVDPQRPEALATVDEAEVAMLVADMTDRHLLYQVFRSEQRRELKLARLGDGSVSSLGSVPVDLNDDFASVTRGAFSAVDERFVYVGERAVPGTSETVPALILDDATEPDGGTVLNEVLTAGSAIRSPMRADDGSWVVYVADLEGRGPGVWRVAIDRPGHSQRLSAPDHSELRLLAVDSRSDRVLYELIDDSVWLARLSQPEGPKRVAALEAGLGVQPGVVFSETGVLFAVGLRPGLAGGNPLPPVALFGYRFGQPEAEALYEAPRGERSGVIDYYPLLK